MSPKARKRLGLADKPKPNAPIASVVIDGLLDEIKDAIDRLHEIKNERQRRESAQELHDYLSLHYPV